MGLAGAAMLMNIINFLYSLLITMGWSYYLILLGGGAKRYSLKVSTHNPVSVNVHSLEICLISYRDFYLFSYRPVGMYSDSNCFSYLLSPTAPAPRSRCIGEQVARFARPFEARPVDPARRELYKQLAASSGSSSTSGWVAPTTTLPVSPPLWQEALRKALLEVSQVPKASDGISAKHPAALWRRH